MATEQQQLDTLARALASFDYGAARITASVLCRLCDRNGVLSSRPLALAPLLGALANMLHKVSSGQTSRSVDDVGREVVRSIRAVGSLDVDDVKRLDHMNESDLARLRHECDRRIERTADVRAREVVAALDAQRRSPTHRLLGVLVAYACEAFDLTLATRGPPSGVFITADGVAAVPTARELFAKHARERLAQPLGAAALEVEVERDDAPKPFEPDDSVVRVLSLGPTIVDDEGRASWWYASATGYVIEAVRVAPLVPGLTLDRFAIICAGIGERVAVERAAVPVLLGELPERLRTVHPGDRVRVAVSGYPEGTRSAVCTLHVREG